jgi:serine-type D-Ala-D-Ala endopeptidase (penicillin-binding protein 7)
VSQRKASLLLAVTSALLLAAGGAQATTRHHHSAAPNDGGPGLRSAAALVVDPAKPDAPIYAKHADDAAPIASITKLMTVLVVSEAHQSLDEPVTVTQDDCAIGKGAFSRLVVGTVLSRRDLIHLALMASENRAAHALGRTYPGGLEAAVAAMNDKAQELGMTHTHYVEPTGLDEHNVASPGDLSKLVQAASQDQLIREYSTDEQYSVRIGRRLVQFRNTDALVRNPGWTIVVQKTGFINEAGRCLVMKAVIDAREVIIVLLNGYGKNTRIADARRIKRWMEETVARASAHT